MPKHIKFSFQSIVSFNAQPRLKSQIQHTEIHSLTLIQFMSKLEISHFWNFVSVFSSSCAFVVSLFLYSHFVVPFHMTRNTFTWFILARRAAHTHFWYETQIDVLVHAFTLHVKMCAKVELITHASKMSKKEKKRKQNRIKQKSTERQKTKQISKCGRTLKTPWNSINAHCEFNKNQQTNAI